MTREEAEAVAARLVTVEDDSFDLFGTHYAAWVVRIGDRTVEEVVTKNTPGVDGEALGNAWREAIVRALVGVG